MTYSTSLDATAPEPRAARRMIAPVGVLTFATSAVWTVLGAHDTTEIAVVLTIAAVVTGGVYGLLLPRTLRKGAAGGTALTLAVLAVVLTLPAFWTGLPLILGAAAVLLGSAGRNAVSGSGKSLTAVVLGALAVIAYFTIYLVDGVVLGNL